MSKLSDLKKELRELRKKHCPPTGKMKKADVEKEIDRLKGVEKHTEYVAPPSKPREKKAKKEMKEMEVQTEAVEEEKPKRKLKAKEEKKPKMSMAERMAKVRAAKEEKKEAKTLKVETEEKPKRKLKAKEEDEEEREREEAKKIAEEIEKMGKPQKKAKKEDKKKVIKFSKDECDRLIQTVEYYRTRPEEFGGTRIGDANARSVVYANIEKLTKFCKDDSPYKSINDIPPAVRRGFSAWAKNHKFSL